MRGRTSERASDWWQAQEKPSATPALLRHDIIARCLPSGDRPRCLSRSRYPVIPLSRQVIEVTLGIERRHATAGSRGAGLAVDVILNVAGGKDTGDAGLRRIALTTALRNDVALVQFELADEQVGIRLVTDGNEDTIQRQVLRRAALHVLDTHAGYAALVAENFFERRIPLDRDLAGLFLFEQLVLHDFFAAQLVASMDERNMAGDVGQIQRFLDSGITAADDGNRLVFIEETVAGRAGGNAATGESLFRRQAEILRRSAGGDDQRIAGICAGIANQRERFFGQFGCGRR